MEQSPSWEANSHSASQEISHLLWNPKVHYRVQNSPPLVQVHPVHTFPSNYCTTHSHIILPFMNGFSKWSLRFRISVQILYGFLSPSLPVCSNLFITFLTYLRKGKVVPLFKRLPPWRRMGERKYDSMHFNVRTTMKWLVSLTYQPLYLRGKNPSTHWIEGWMGLRAGLDAVAKRKSLPGFAPRFGSLCNFDLDTVRIRWKRLKVRTAALLLYNWWWTKLQSLCGSFTCHICIRDLMCLNYSYCALLLTGWLRNDRNYVL
jgi:hypothetical protein